LLALSFLVNAFQPTPEASSRSVMVWLLRQTNKSSVERTFCPCLWHADQLTQNWIPSGYKRVGQNRWRDRTFPGSSPRFCFPGAGGFPWLTVEGNIDFGLFKLPAAERKQRIAKYCRTDPFAPKQS